MLEKLMSKEDYQKLLGLDNKKVIEVAERAVELMKPKDIVVISDNTKDIKYIRQEAMKRKEEHPLKMEGHTIHWDSYKDQARDKKNTRVLLEPGQKLDKRINVKDREEGLKEIFEIMNGTMEGKTMIIAFYCLGPANSRFSISAMQITDSFYVAHSEFILYRPGYEQMKLLEDKNKFFYFYHSAGKLDARNTTINIDKRRIYIDLKEERVFSVNNQYAGNSLACKKLSLRLAIARANNEDWLTEHMFIAGIKHPNKDRITYFSGAYPSACGKTSTSMIPGNSVVGDDIAYIRKDEEGNARIVNIEQGIFGIITDVNEKDDPYIWHVLNSPRELIFSNILISEDKKPYWLNMGIPEDKYPIKGLNNSGDWYKGKTEKVEKDGKLIDQEIPIAHKNSRYTVRISELENSDPNLNNPDGVILDAILFGGRDSDTTVPIAECLNWKHGVFTGATIESETTAATLGKEGQRKSNPMSIIDFMVVPFPKYIKNYLKFGETIKRVPKVFATNYFLRDLKKEAEIGDPKKRIFLNEKVDKKVWVTWGEGRVHNEYGAIETPIGNIPKYEDLKQLFSEIFNRDYSKQEYIDQFSIRIDKYLEKYDRVKKDFENEQDMPKAFWDEYNRIKDKLDALKSKLGKSVISPFEL